jgi:hypothetical protein
MESGKKPFRSMAEWGEPENRNLPLALLMAISQIDAALM